MSRQFKTNYLKKQRQRYLKRILLLFLFVFLVGILTYFIVFSNLFKIEHVRIVGSKRVPQELIGKEIDNILSEQKMLPLNDNLIFFNDLKVKQIFFADIQNIYTTKNFFTRTLSVHVVEKQPIAKISFEFNEDSAFVDSVNGNMYLDDSGKVFQSKLINNDKVVNVLIKQQNTNIPKTLLESDKMNHFVKLIQYLNSNKNYINNFEFEYSLNTPNAIVLKLKGYYRAYLTLNQDIIGAFNASEGFYEKESQNNSVISSYIDMRYYPEKLYYK